MARRSITLCKTSEKKIDTLISKVKEFVSDTFGEKFKKQILYDIKNIRDCSEKSIVDFYCETADKMISDGKIDTDENFFNELKKDARIKLSYKYTQQKTFDDNIDIYFNDVKNIYIQHPQAESYELEFIPENKETFIHNNLKLVIECAKRYRGLGLEFADLIQAGNVGLMIAFDKFDKDRANLRFAIMSDIEKSTNDTFTFDEAEEIIRKNFTYSKNLEATLSKIPKEGFSSKEEFIEWSKINIKTAVFASVAFQWIRANIIIELNKYGKIINMPKSIQKELGSLSIINLDSLNPHTNDCYHDNQMAEYINNEFIGEDEAYEEQEEKEKFKDIVEELLDNLSLLDRRIIKKKFGIGYPYPMSVMDIADSEDLPQNKVKYSINNTMKILAEKAKNKKLVNELFS